MFSGALVCSGRAVVLGVPLERAREQHEARRLRRFRSNVTHRGGGTRERGCVIASFQGGPDEKLTAFAIVLRVEPRLFREELLDFRPTIPSGGGSGRKQKRGVGARLRHPKYGRDELRGAPRMSRIERG